MILLYNARIYTLNPKQPTVSAALIDDYGRIAAVGSDDSLAASAPIRTQRVNLNGQTVLPGLTDAHIHLQMYSESLARLNCELPTKEECLTLVAERARTLPAGKWILGHGWNQNEWNGFGTATELDRAAPFHPVFLTDKSIHAAWVNSAALKLAGITDTTPNPPGGEIVRAEDGKATGILLENATDLFTAILPEPDEKELAAMLLTGQTSLHRMGITSVHDYDRSACFNALQYLNHNHQLRLRVLKGIAMDDAPHALSLGLRSGFGNMWLRIGNVKLFADGALGPQTAAMLQPYEGSDSLGTTILDKEEIVEIGQQVAKQGFGLAIHAIGDRANHEVLDAYAELRRMEVAAGLPHLRHRIEHVQLLHPQDIPRLAELDVIASMQPYHVISDMFTADRHWGQRAQYSYAWQSVLSSGAKLAFGSDAPVESPNPFWGLHAAVTRRRADGLPGAEGWQPQERVSLMAALQGYTTGAAYASGWENQLGQIQPGFLADLIVLERDIFDLPPSELRDIQPLAVMVGGDWVVQGIGN